MGFTVCTSEGPTRHRFQLLREAKHGGTMKLEAAEEKRKKIEITIYDLTFKRLFKRPVYTHQLPPTAPMPERSHDATI